MNVIIFGPPGAGKGTQAQNIVNNFNLHQVATGDLLRIEIKKRTKISKKIEQIIAQGDLVSDDIVNQLLEKYVFDPQKKSKLIFDGYPRSLSQAKNLDLLLKDPKSEKTVKRFLVLKFQKSLEVF